ncbi:retron system putative HNH endonuclease [Anoxybacillus sp. J5B_2022]|uniref:retron system putative HNH endonuclease n=1 Tax=Anoxybacillus sp. J5B_2022 TaxID=3003246 RepID=UPI002285805F|nr:retron system putative HNH endonuclease [Anoxybacillus sp. J5B_2022]MCZ0756984.1 TIGR02646 family protein [Anoxybacillus sp. J5B_2022]
MKKVTRTDIPLSLKNNADRWTKQLLQEIQLRGGWSQVPKSLREKYKQPDVKKALEQMYKGKCCYCENGIGVESYEQIEHLKPKSLPPFHHLTYDWNNLHWCCSRCNQAKRDQWNDSYPIVDPTTEDPEQYITFDVVTGEVIALHPRGETTIQHADLNREKLVQSRNKVGDFVRELIFQLKRTESQLDIDFYRGRIVKFADEDAEFSSFIKQLINTYL